MILSTENGALRSLVGERRAIEILAKAGFDAIDYTFTPGWSGGDALEPGRLSGLCQRGGPDGQGQRGLL